MIPWESGLNSEQYDAITNEGSVFLVACPGSGKTRTLTYKAIYELERLKSRRHRIAAITYTNRAADEISDRIESHGAETSQLWIGTIHSFCMEWILKPYGIYHPKLEKGFRIIDAHESDELMAEICLRPSIKRARVTKWDCGFFFELDGRITLSCTDAKKTNAINEVIEEYLTRLLAAHAIDYQLMLLFAWQIIDSNPSIAKVLSNVFPQILIDEYQDTQMIQYAIVAKLLEAGSGRTNAFIVGDPNQAIFGSLGGFAMEIEELSELAKTSFTARKLSTNYRSAGRVIEYFKNFRVFPSTIMPSEDLEMAVAQITYNDSIVATELGGHIASLIFEAVSVDGVSMNEICIVAPQWIQLAPMTRRLTEALPDYEFNGPGMMPFSKDLENFWYKVARLALTSASPDMYVRRCRWAREVLHELETAGVSASVTDARGLLRACNSIVIEEDDGIEYLHVFFRSFASLLNFNLPHYTGLLEHQEQFFASSAERIARIQQEHDSFVADVESFRRVFRPKSGITISTIHGVKGAEFDTVIAFGLLEDWLPHFSDPDPDESANKLLYVIGSRARRNLHLISERGRVKGGWGGVRAPTGILQDVVFSYDS